MTGVADYDPFDVGQNEDNRLVAGGSFVLDEPDETPVIWGDGEQVLWAAGEGFMICGPQGVGKSTLAQQLMLARIGVRPPTLLGLNVTATDGRVGYIAGDRPRQIARSLRRMVTENDRAELDKRLVVWKGPPPFDIPRQPKILADWAERLDLTTVWLDSYKDLVPGLTQDEVGALVNIAVQELLSRGIEFCGLHHQRKANSENRKPDRLDDVYGSAWLTAGLGSVAILWSKPGGSAVELMHLKQPSEPVGPLSLVHDHARGTSRSRDVEDDLVNALLDAGGRGLTDAEAAEMLFGSDDRKERKRAERRLDALVRRDLARHEPGRRGGKGGGGAPPRWFAE